MDTKGYCKLCGQIKQHFCCQSCYEQDATKSIKKSELSARIAALEAQNAELQKRIIDFEQSVSEDEREDKDRIAELVKALEEAVHEIKMQFAIRFNDSDFKTVGEKSPAVLNARAVLAKVTK